MNKNTEGLKEFVKNSLGKELNNVVPIFLSGADFCGAVQNLTNSAFYGRWFFSHPPHDIDVVGSLLAVNPILIFSLLGKTVAAVRLAEYNYHASPQFDVLFDEVFLSGENIDALSVNAVSGALSYVADVPPGGTPTEKALTVFNDLTDAAIQLRDHTSGGMFTMPIFTSNLQSWVFPHEISFVSLPPYMFVVRLLDAVSLDYRIIYVNSSVHFIITRAMVEFGGSLNVQLRVAKQASGVAPGGVGLWRYPDGSLVP